MLKLIYGPSGSGKTNRINDMIINSVRAGRKTVLLVPEQETVMRERKMLDILPPSAQLIFEVSNFTRLANRVFREYGGLTYNYVTSPVKSLAVWNTLRVLSPLLREYGKQKGDLSFSEMMLSQIEEFKTYGISPAMLERAAERAEGNSRLADKLEDLSLIYATYSNFLSDYGKGDASDDIGKLAEKLSEHNYFKDFDIYIDSFMSFTASQKAVLSQIIKQASNVVAAFCSEEGGALQFDAVNRSMRSLADIAERAGCETEFEKLTENKRTGDKALCRLGRDLWRFDAKPDEEDYNTGSVELIKCTNVYEEAEAVCGAISKLVMGGMRYRDIVIIAGNAKNYEGIIDSALEKAEIPYFMSKSTNVTSMPLAKLLLCAFRIKNKGWRTEDVITYIKTGLCGVPMRDADLFEQYIWKWSISGSAFLGEEWTMDPDSYSAKVSERNVDTLDTVNRCRSALTAPLVTLFDKVDAAETNVDICRAVFEYMQELKISDQLRSFAEDTSLRGNKAEASEALRLYNTVLDVLEILAELDCGTERYDSAEFEQALNIVLSETEMGNIPTSCDEVTVGSASLLRADSPKCAILIGVNEGVFPRNVLNGGMLTDDERHFLSEIGIELAGDSEERSSEELFYVYRAVSAPSEKLIMTYSASELQGGKALMPSLAFERTRLLLSAPVIDYALLPLSERLWSRDVAFEYTPLAFGEEAEALSRYFSEKDEYSDRLAARYIPICDSACHVPAEMSDLIFGRHMSFSPSALEKYVKCHFDYWCEYVLKLRADEKNAFRLSDTGSLVHALLENFIKSVTDEHGFNSELAEDKIDELIEELMRLYIEENFPEKDRNREQIKHVFYKLSHLSRLLAKNITAELSKSRFVPSFFELKINERDNDAIKPLEFKLSDGSSVSLRGIVDRVDLFRSGEDIYVKVVDYKTGAKQFSMKDIDEGLNLQMLLYLFSICADSGEQSQKNKKLLGCSDGGRLIPAGVVYLSSKIKSVDADSNTDKEIIFSDADKNLQRSGILLSDENVLRAVNTDMDYRFMVSVNKRDPSKALKNADEFGEISKTVSDKLIDIFNELRSGNACISPLEHDGMLPCEYCRMRSVCRVKHIEKNEEGDED